MKESMGDSEQLETENPKLETAPRAYGRDQS
jgi:hypothetical protein